MAYNKSRLVMIALLGALGFISAARAAWHTASSPEHRAPQTPPSIRLYVFDCGTLHITDLGRFQLKKEEVATSDLSVACFLIAHPKGTLIWDTGAVPDTAWKPTGTAVTQHVVLPDSQERDVTMIRPLMVQDRKSTRLNSSHGYISYAVFCLKKKKQKTN